MEEEKEVKKVNVKRLLNTAKGQIDGILRMLEQDRNCTEISNQVMAATAILRKVNNEIVGKYLTECVDEAVKTGNNDEKIKEMIGIINNLTKY